MSMISEQVQRLQILAKEWESFNVDTPRELLKAANTIEVLSAKVRANNLSGGWIPFADQKPEPDERVLVSDGAYVWEDMMKEWDDELWLETKSGLGDLYEMAWMPLPPVWGGKDHE